MTQAAILEAFAELPDPRRLSGQRHTLPICLAYTLYVEMAQKLQDANRAAFRNIVNGMLEAYRRRFWQPAAEKLEEIRML